MESLEVLSAEPASKGRYRIRFDNGETWILYQGEMRRFGIAEGAYISRDVYEGIRSEVVGKRAIKRAMHLLERMDRTERDLRRKLSESEYPEDLVDAAIDYVKRYHYLDDARYADDYVRLHGSSKSRGRLLQELQQKGVGREEACLALAEHDDARDEPRMIRELLEKRSYDPRSATPEEQRRVYGFLSRRGFSSEDIMREIAGE